MAKYNGLIIPRSYNDYVNKSDPISVSQALQLTGVMDNAPTAQSTKPAKSGGIFAANAVIMADSATLSGVAISAGSVVRVLFTADLTGSDATTGLTLTYNGNAYAVKVGKDGALANFNAYEVESGVFKYLQAYTTLELMFDGTQLIIIGNPVVLSSADYTIYPDGSITYPPVFVLRSVDTIDVRKYFSMANTKGYRGLFVIYANLGYSNKEYSIYLITKYEPADFGWDCLYKVAGYYNLEKDSNGNLKASEGSDLYTAHKSWTIGFWGGFNFI